MKLRMVPMAVAALAFSALPAFAQKTPTYQQKINVRTVLVDATVTGPHGDQILGLGKDDFTILENGVPQKIDTVDYYTNRRLLTSPEDKAKFKVERVKEERYFILFFHKLADTGGAPEMRTQLLRAKTAAVRFVEHNLLPEDRVAVVGFDVRLKVYTDFTNDHRKILDGLDQAVTYGNGIMKPPGGAGPYILAGLNPKKMMDKTGRIYSALAMLAHAVQPIHARKVLVLFSPGVEEPELGHAPFVRYDQVRYDSMLHALNEANVSVYPVNLLQHQFYGPSEDMLTRMATETGGEYFRAVVTYDVPLKRIENENNGYYMLTFQSDKPENEHGYQPIVVKVKNPEFHVTAREGYVY